jgi:hypothetical protein
MSFLKLRNKFEVGSYTKISTKIQYGVDTPLGFAGIKYSYITLSNSQDLLQIIPERYRSDCTLSVMDLNYRIPPHTDSGIEAIVNFYIKTVGCVTQFYKLKNNIASTMQIENQTDGFIYDINDLEETESFIAEDGDAYLLDVSKPHSVITTRPEMIDRKAICMQIKYRSFEEAKEMLQESGNL